MARILEFCWKQQHADQLVVFCDLARVLDDELRIADSTILFG